VSLPPGRSPGSRAAPCAWRGAFPHRVPGTPGCSGSCRALARLPLRGQRRTCPRPAAVGAPASRSRGVAAAGSRRLPAGAPGERV